MHSFSLEINIPDYFKIFYYAITPFLVLRILQNGDNLIENTKTGIFSRVYFSHFQNHFSIGQHAFIQSYLILFLVTLIFSGIKNFMKKGQKGSLYKIFLPLLLCFDEQVHLQIFWVNSFEIGNATAAYRWCFSFVVNSFHTHPFSQEN